MKSIVIFLLFMVAIIGILAPVNAKLYGDMSIVHKEPSNGKIKLYFYVGSDVGDNTKNTHSAKNNIARKKELNNVNKVVINIKGFKSVTVKKPAKGWRMGNEWNRFFERDYWIKGKFKNLVNKNYSLKMYNNKGKLLKNSKGRLYLQ